MRIKFYKPLHLMTDDEAMDYAAEHSAMYALGHFCGTNLLDDFEGHNVVELRRQLEIAARICVKDAIRAKHCLDRITKEAS